MTDRLVHSLAHAHDIPYSRPQTPHAIPQIGFLGLGAMGYFMVRNLVRHLASQPVGAPALLVWNRTLKKAEKLVAELGPDKVKIASSPGQLATDCDVIITNLANDTVVKSIYEEFAKALSLMTATKHKVFVETSTIYPALAGQLDTLIGSKASLITCPVFGAPLAADKAQLIILMSGDYRSKKEVAYLLVPAVGRKIVDLGENLEKAPTFKLIGNSLILGCLEVMAESMTLAEKAGIGSETVNNLIRDLLPAGPLITYGEKMAHDLFDGTKGFAIEGGIKDASHIRHLTDIHNAPMPVIDVAFQHLITARALHAAQRLEGKEQFEVLDWSAIIAGPRVSAGLDGFDSQKHTSLVQDE